MGRPAVSRRTPLGATALAYACLGLLACAGPRHTQVADAARDDVGPVDAPMRPDVGSSVGVTIPWLESDTPAIEAPRIDWLAAGTPPVAAPTLTCPPGWRSVPTTDGIATYCDPWPPSGRATCPAGEAHFPGEGGCSAVGRACPAGQDPIDLPPGAPIVHVRSGAPAGGDGSDAAPFGTIGAALAAAVDGAVITIGRGTFDEALRIDRPVTLRGACSAATILTASGGDETSGAITITATGIVLEDLALGPGPGMGVVVQGGNATLRGLEIQGVHGRAMFAQGSAVTLDVSSVHVSDTAAFADGSRGRPLTVGDGAHATLRRALLERSFDAAIFVGTGSTLDASDVAVAQVGTALPGPHTGGGARVIDTGSSMTLTRFVVEAADAGGVVAVSGGTATLTDGLVREAGTRVHAGTALGVALGSMSLTRVAAVDTSGQALYTGADGAGITGNDVVVDGVVEADDSQGIAIYANGGDITLERAHVTAVRGDGVFAASGGVVALTDARVRSVLAAGGGGGSAAHAWSMGTIDATRSVFERTSGTGVIVEAGSVTLTDVAVADAGALAVRVGDPLGIHATTGATLTLARVLVRDAVDIGIAVESSRLDATDLAVLRVAPRPFDSALGRGIDLESSDSTLARVSIEEVTDVGLFVSDPSVVAITDLVVHGVACSARDGRLGRGVNVQGAQVDLTRARIEAAHDYGIYAAGSMDQHTLSLHDVVVRDVDARGLDATGGAGIVLSIGRYTLERVLVERVRESGLGIFGPYAEVSATDVTVRDVREAACATSGTCAGPTASIGVGVYRSGHLSLARFRIERSPSIAVQLATYGALDLADGDIVSSPIGINVQVPSYAFDRLTPLVRFEDVAVPLDAQYLPVPGAGTDAS